MENTMNEGSCRWISVEERLPELGRFYTITTQHGKLVDGFLAGDKTWRFAIDPDSTIWESNVTHWLEVIPPPVPKKKVEKMKSIYITLRDDGEIEQVYHNYPPRGCVQATITYEVQE